MTLSLFASAAPAQAAEGALQIFPELTASGLLLLLGLAVFFALLVPPVNALLVKPIFRVLDEREARISGTRARAEQLASEADAVASRYEDAIRSAREGFEQDRREKLEVARSEGASGMAEARTAAEQEIEEARSEMGRALSEARTALRGEAERLAREAATRVLGRSL